jgi:hypothetical protein
MDGWMEEKRREVNERKRKYLINSFSFCIEAQNIQKYQNGCQTSIFFLKFLFFFILI